jgi:hypothetical protein
MRRVKAPAASALTEERRGHRVAGSVCCHTPGWLPERAGVQSPGVLDTPPKRVQLPPGLQLYRLAPGLPKPAPPKP